MLGLKENHRKQSAESKRRYTARQGSSVGGEVKWSSVKIKI